MNLCPMRHFGLDVRHLTLEEETFVKLEREASKGPAHAWWSSESGVMDVVVMVGPSPKQVSTCESQVEAFW